MVITCPKCREPNIRRSRRRMLDFLFRRIGMVPLRCNVCEHRFFRFRKSLDVTSDLTSDVTSADLSRSAR